MQNLRIFVLDQDLVRIYRAALTSSSPHLSRRMTSAHTATELRSRTPQRMHQPELNGSILTGGAARIESDISAGEPHPAQAGRCDRHGARRAQAQGGGRVAKACGGACLRVASVYPLSWLSCRQACYRVETRAERKAARTGDGYQNGRDNSLSWPHTPLQLLGLPHRRYQRLLSAWHYTAGGPVFFLPAVKWAKTTGCQQSIRPGMWLMVGTFVVACVCGTGDGGSGSAQLGPFGAGGGRGEAGALLPPLPRHQGARVCIVLRSSSNMDPQHVEKG